MVMRDVVAFVNFRLAAREVKVDALK